MHDDPFSKLFGMYQQHADNQITLTKTLLSLKIMNEQRKDVEARYLRNKDATDESGKLEREQASSKLDAIDDEIAEAEKRAKKLVELLTGVSLDVIADANL